MQGKERSLDEMGAITIGLICMNIELTKIIELTISRIKDNKLVLYPYGNNGFLIKAFLNNVFGYKEYAIIDEKMSKYIESIYSIDDIKNNPELNGCVYLITSDRYPFAKYLIEQNINRANIISPYISDRELVMDCFIDILNNSKYKNIMDFSQFLFTIGQMSEVFHSTLDNNYFWFRDISFIGNPSNGCVPEFYQLYSNDLIPDSSIAVVNRGASEQSIDSLIKELLCMNTECVIISFDQITNKCISCFKESRYSFLFLYKWEK